LSETEAVAITTGKIPFSQHRRTTAVTKSGSPNTTALACAQYLWESIMASRYRPRSLIIFWVTAPPESSSVFTSVSIARIPAGNGSFTNGTPYSFLRYSAGELSAFVYSENSIVKRAPAVLEMSDNGVPPVFNLL